MIDTLIWFMLQMLFHYHSAFKNRSNSLELSEFCFLTFCSTVSRKFSIDLTLRVFAGQLIVSMPIDGVLGRDPTRSVIIILLRRSASLLGYLLCDAAYYGRGSSLGYKYRSHIHSADFKIVILNWSIYQQQSTHKSFDISHRLCTTLEICHLRFCM